MTVSTTTSLTPRKDWGNGKKHSLADRGYPITWADTVDPKPILWLWPPYIPAGALTIIEGDPGIGKSWISCAIATAVANGEALPGMDPERIAPPQRVLIASAEDDLAYTIIPRLINMNANRSMIGTIDPNFTLDKKGIDLVEETVQDAAAAILFIDPIVAYLGPKMDMNAANHVRAVMAPLAAVAERTGCAIVAVRHLRKASSDNGLYRGIGSIDFTAAARSVLGVTYARDGKTKIVRHVKHNLTPPGATLSFYMDTPVQLTRTPPGALPTSHWDVGYFHWGPMFEEDEYGPAASVNRTPKARAKAQEFLISFLNQGAKPALEVIRAAEAVGINEKTLKRAKHGLVVSDKELNQWVWRLTLPGETQLPEENGND